MVSARGRARVSAKDRARASGIVLLLHAPAQAAQAMHLLARVRARVRD